MQGSKSKLQSFFKPPALHASPAWKGLEHGEKEWHSFGACCAAAATIPILRGILVAFLFNGHALAIIYLWGVAVVFRPECDVYMCCCPPLTSSQEKREWETSNSPRGMEEKSACMGCSCWPFAIITLIKVESWYGCMEWIPSFLFIMTPILDRLWHADTWVRWCGCVLLLGAGLVWLGVSGSDTLFMCQHGWVHSTSVFYLHASAVF